MVDERVPGRPADEAADPDGFEQGADSPPSPDQPATIGPYRVLGRLGEGGMGVVYLGEQRTPVLRRVAVKVIKLGMDSKAVLARFDAERQALSMMSHDAIARVHDCGVTAAGQPYFAMEYVKGVPITDYCDRTSLSLMARLALFQQVCAGVQHAHLKGVMHRDLKPGNVLVAVQDGKPVVKIIDFGLAKAIDQRLVEATLFTQQGQVLGTPEYMSPEQAGLDGLDIDTRTDVYSLGVLLYELLTGQLPFSRQQLLQAGWFELQRLLREQEPPRPSTRVTMLGASAEAVAHARQLDTSALMRHLRGDLDWVVLRALEKDRTRRYATPIELAADLERFLRHEPVLACPPSAGYRLRKLLARHRGKVAAAAAILLTAVVGAVIAVDQAWEAQRQAAIAGTNERLADARASDAERERLRADDEARRALALADEAQQNAYVANMTAASVAFESENYDVVRRRLDAAPEAMRGWEWRQIDASLHDWAVQVPGSSAAFSPDGMWLAVSRGSEVCLVDPSTGAVGRVLHGCGWTSVAPAFRRDGAQIATAHHDASVSIVDIATDRVVRSLTAPPLTEPVCSEVAFAADGAMVLVTGFMTVDGRNEKWTLVWGPDNSAPARVPGHGRFIGPGHRLLITDVPGREGRSGHSIAVLDGDATLQEVGRWVASGVTASRDGTRLALDSFDAVSVWSIGGGLEVELTHSRGRLTGENGLCLDDQVAYSVYDGTILLRDLADKEPRAELSTGLLECRGTVVGRDGTRLLVRSQRGRAQVWDLASGTRIGEVRGLGTWGDVVASPRLDMVAQPAWESGENGAGDVVRVWHVANADNTTRMDGVVAVGAELDRVAEQRREVVIHRIADQACLQTVALAAAESPVGWCEATATLVTNRDGLLRQWSEDGTRLLRQYRGIEKDVCGAAIRPGGEVVALADDGWLRGWDLHSGACTFELKANPMSAPADIEISSDGRYLACKSWRGGDRPTPVFDLREQRAITSLSGHFRGLVPGGRAMTSDTAKGDGTRFWDLATGQAGPTCAIVGSIHWDAQGERCVSSSLRTRERRAVVHDGRTGEAVLTLAEAGVSRARMSPDGTRILTLAYDDEGTATVKLWDAVNGACLRTLATGSDGIDVGAADVYLAWDSESVHIFHEDGTEAGRIECHGDEPEVVGPGRAHLVLQRKRIVVHDVTGGTPATTCGTWDQVVLDRTGRFALGRTVRGLQLREWSTGHTVSFGAEDLAVERAAFAFDSSQVAIASIDSSSLSFWDTATALRRAAVALPDDLGSFDAATMVWSQDGHWLAIAGDHLCIVDVARAAVAITLPAAAEAVAFSPDGKRMAFAKDKCIVLETATWQQQFAIEDSWRGLAFSPSGDRLATSSWSDVAIWDAANGQRTGSLQLPQQPRALAWSRDGARIATGGEDHVVRIWSPTTGAELGQLRGLDKPIRRLVWSADGTRLLALDEDGAARVWDSRRRADRVRR